MAKTELNILIKLENVVIEILSGRNWNFVTLLLERQKLTKKHNDEQTNEQTRGRMYYVANAWTVHS